MELQNAQIKEIDGANVLQALIKNGDGLSVLAVKIDGKGNAAGKEAAIKPEANWHDEADRLAKALLKAK